MDSRLSLAAQEGDINTLYTLLSQDPHLLENLDRFPFLQTPLHIAALSRQTSFLMEVLNLKPSFLRKLNTDGYSPIHLASIEGDVEMVRELLEFDNDLGLLKGREWRTPIHCAVINGRKEVLSYMLSTCSWEWLKALTVRKETVLHLALKYGQMDVFEILIEEVRVKDDKEIMNWKDREGNTILHIAAETNQFQIIELLLGTNDFHKMMDVDVKNINGLTSLDVLRQHSTDGPNNAEIERILVRVGATRVQDTIVTLATHPPNRQSSLVEPLIVLEGLFSGLPMEKWAKEIENSPTETRTTLMVVAVLILTVTFQTVLTPPDFKVDSLYILYAAYGPRMGTPIPKHPVVELLPELFNIINAVGFMASVVMITLLTRRFPLKALLRMAVLSMVGTYFSSLVLGTYSLVIVTLVIVSAFTILLVQWIHLKIRSVKKLFLR